MSPLDYYAAHAGELCERYEDVSTEDVHASWLDLCPDNPGAVLDIGAGTGRDAGWFAVRGYDVVAVEPVRELREYGRAHHPEVIWLDDRLPALEQVHALGNKYDIILLSAVWMHIPPGERERAFRKVAGLLRPGGLLVLTYRGGPDADGRGMHPCTREEISLLAGRFALETVRTTEADDRLGRDEVTWTTVVLRLPDDGTGAFALLRHIALNDAKSSTYKLALLRVLLRIADGARGAVISRDEEKVSLPFGLVALYWVRMFQPLVLEHDCPQHPRGNAGLGFVKEPFRALKDISPFDLRIGMNFSGDPAVALSLALRDARNTIRTMPACYITWPGSDRPVFECHVRPVRASGRLTLDTDFLSRYGTFHVPRHVWDTLSHYSCWIEPVILSEWARLMAAYEPDGHKLTLDQHHQALAWLDPERDTRLVRERVAGLQAEGRNIYCVWTGRRLKKSFEIDHLFPYARWGNNDLWNLLPATRDANAKKSDRLPSVPLLEDARERIIDWWQTAWAGTPREQRFLSEAGAALPGMHAGNTDDAYDRIFRGIRSQRLRLRTDQQLGEWGGER